MSSSSSAEQLQQADRAGHACLAAADDRDADLDPLVLGVRRRRRRTPPPSRPAAGTRWGRRTCYEPFFAFTASVSFGTILFRSPTMPRSENSKIGALESLLMATMFSEACMPTLCWIAPEMPAAR